MKVLYVAGTILALIVGWFALGFLVIAPMMGANEYDADGSLTRSYIISAVIVAGVYWLIHTGRLAKLFRKV